MLAGVPMTPISTEGAATAFADRFPARCDRVLALVGL